MFDEGIKNSMSSCLHLRKLQVSSSYTFLSWIFKVCTNLWFNLYIYLAKASYSSARQLLRSVFSLLRWYRFLLLLFLEKKYSRLEYSVVFWYYTSSIKTISHKSEKLLSSTQIKLSFLIYMKNEHFPLFSWEEKCFKTDFISIF